MLIPVALPLGYIASLLSTTTTGRHRQLDKPQAKREGGAARQGYIYMYSKHSHNHTRV